MDKVDIWLNAVTASHTSGEITKGTEAVRQPFSGAAPGKRAFPVTFKKDSLEKLIHAVF